MSKEEANSPTSMSVSKYMHTINGRPAYYHDDEQLIYLNSTSRVTKDEVLVDSLDEIRQQQAQSIKWRRGRGYTDTSGTYSYIRIGGF